MSESKSQSSFIIPITVAVTVIATIVSASLFMGGLSKQTDVNTDDILAIKTEIKDLPKRSEFNDLKASVDKANENLLIIMLNLGIKPKTDIGQK